MVGAVVHFYDQLEDGLSGGIKYYYESLIYSLRNLGVTDLYIVDNSTYQFSKKFQNYDSQINVEVSKAMCDIYGNFVYLENQWTIDREPTFSGIPIKDFVHPENPVYVVGPDKGQYKSPTECEYVVLTGVDDLIAEDALKIVLFDRISKL